MLKDEIRKPYFITLKKFLWEEGVRDASYSPVPLKVFPPGNLHHKISNSTPAYPYASHFVSKGHLLVVEHAIG